MGRTVVKKRRPHAPPSPVLVPIEAFLQLVASHDREREAWARERAELLTRIQAWNPPPPDPEREQEPAGHASSQPDEVSEEPPEDEGFTREQLALMGLIENSGGGYVHAVTGVMYERVSDFKAWQAWLAERGLPLGTKPGDVDQNLVVGG